MKAIVMALLVILFFASPTAWAQEVEVFTDRQGVQTYTNLRPSRRRLPRPVKDAQGAQIYTNVPASRRTTPSPAKDKRGVRLFTNVPPSAVGNHRSLLPLREESAGLASAFSGQWVYTEQYRWIWMPYGAEYVSEGPTGRGNPYAFVYEPGAGWTWLTAPWVRGRGPQPYFGELGPSRFGWYRGVLRADHR